MALKEVQPLAQCVFAADGILAFEKNKNGCFISAPYNFY